MLMLMMMLCIAPWGWSIIYSVLIKWDILLTSSKSASDVFKIDGAHRHGIRIRSALEVFKLDVFCSELLESWECDCLPHGAYTLGKRLLCLILPVYDIRTAGIIIPSYITSKPYKAIDDTWIDGVIDGILQGRWVGLPSGWEVDHMSSAVGCPPNSRGPIRVKSQVLVV